MTCVIGFVDKEGTIWMGGDAAGINTVTFDYQQRNDSKVFLKDGMLYGFCDSFRIGQLIKYCFKRPEWNGEPIMEYLCGSFIDKLIEVLEDGKALSEENHTAAISSRILIGFQNRLFIIEDDFQINDKSENFTAIGSGEQYAVGCISGLMNYDKDLNPHAILTLALQTAENFNSCVKKPFTIINNK